MEANFLEEQLEELRGEVIERVLDQRVVTNLDSFLGEDRDIDPESKKQIVSITRAVLENGVIDESIVEAVMGNVELSFLLPAFMTSLGLPPTMIPKWSATIRDEESSKRTIAAYRYAQMRIREFTARNPEVRWKWLGVILEGFKLKELKGENDLKIVLAMSLPTMLNDAKAQYGKQRFNPYLEAIALGFELNYQGSFSIETHYAKLKPPRLIINNTAFEGGRLVNHSRAVEPLAAILAQPVPVKGKQTSSVPLILTDEFWQVVEDFNLPVTTELREIEWPRYFYL